jgi:IS1 family transposase
VFWFQNKRKGHENGVNLYIMTMISRQPRQIVAFAVDNQVKESTIQSMVDSSPMAENYYTDGGGVYLGVDFFGRHRRNVHNKNDTYIIEGTNADLRHYIAGLRRKSRCFFRKKETLKAVLTNFVEAYNKFGEAKEKFKQRHPDCGRDFGFNHTQFI